MGGKKNMNEIILEKKHKEYILKNTITTIFSCYEGDKDYEELQKNPQLIEEDDYKHIGLPWVEIETAKEIITLLVKDLY